MFRKLMRFRKRSERVVVLKLLSVATRERFSVMKTMVGMECSEIN